MSDALDDILDGNLDDLSDVPEFKPFPNGAHKVTIHFERKEVNKHPCVEVKMKALETLELNDPEKDQPLEKGAEGSVLYMLDNDIGQGKFKELMKPFAAHYEKTKLSELMKEGNGNEVAVVINQRPNKDKTAMYMDIVNLQMA
jgi:hypothetical protein